MTEPDEWPELNEYSHVCVFPEGQTICSIGDCTHLKDDDDDKMLSVW